jgi:hypothetical protein
MFEPLTGRFTCAHVRPEETALVTGILCKIVTHCDHVWWTSVALRAPLYIERRSFIPIQSAPPFQRARWMIQLVRSSLTVCCIALVCMVTSLSCNKDGTSDIIHPIDDTSPSFGDFFPDWSPDGQWIAYIHDDPLDSLHPSGLYVVDTAGNHSRLLRRGYVTTPVWSQDGLWIAFQSGRYGLFALQMTLSNRLLHSLPTIQVGHPTELILLLILLTVTLSGHIPFGW